MNAHNLTEKEFTKIVQKKHDKEAHSLQNVILVHLVSNGNGTRCPISLMRCTKKASMTLRESLHEVKQRTTRESLCGQYQAWPVRPKVAEV